MRQSLALIIFTFSIACSAFGDLVTPKDTADWQVLSAWTAEKDRYRLIAESQTLTKQCLDHPDQLIEAPPVFYGHQSLSVNGHIVGAFSDKELRWVDSIYGTLLVRCSDLPAKGVVRWEAVSPAEYFARARTFPAIREGNSLTNVFASTINSAAAAILIVMGIMSGIIFHRRFKKLIVPAFVASNFLFSIYAMLATPASFGITFDVVSVNKVGDLSLWFGQLFYSHCLRAFDLIPKKLYYSYVGLIGIAVGMISFGHNVDQIQNGTSFPFVFTFIVLLVALYRLGKKIQIRRSDLPSIFQFLALFTNFSLAFNDMLVISDIYVGPMLFPVGVVSNMFFFSLSLHRNIVETYKERDYLRKNLQLEVDRQTEQLKLQKDQLNDALGELRATQGELIQSAKLASLGTLAAGVAHEINNSLNYASGALVPFEKKYLPMLPPEHQKKAGSLIELMKEGFQITFEIIKSLKTYTGLNSPKLGRVNVEEVVRSVMTMSKSKLNELQDVTVDVPSHLEIMGSTVGLSQVLTNLVGNAADAVGPGGAIKICAQLNGEDIIIEVSDNGPGIPEEVLDRIFEPFFTTKEVGSGTGLGMHIVKMEIDRHHGKIDIETSPEGTTFKIRIPSYQDTSTDISQGSAA